MNSPYPCHVHGLHYLSVNGLYDLYINDMDIISTNVCPLDILGMQNIYVTGLKRLSVNVRPRDVRESMDVMSGVVYLV